MELCVIIQVLLRNCGVHDFLHDVLPEGFEGDLLAVLAGDHHSVDPDGDAGPALEHVLSGHLSLRVWSRTPKIFKEKYLQ